MGEASLELLDWVLLLMMLSLLGLRLFALQALEVK